MKKISKLGIVKKCYCGNSDITKELFTWIKEFDAITKADNSRKSTHAHMVN